MLHTVRHLSPYNVLLHVQTLSAHGGVTHWLEHLTLIPCASWVRIPLHLLLPGQLTGITSHHTICLAHKQVCGTFDLISEGMVIISFYSEALKTITQLSQGLMFSKLKE